MLLLQLSCKTNCFCVIREKTITFHQLMVTIRKASFNSFKLFRVMEALKKNGVPIPEMLGLCENCDIIGTPFYLMNYVEGKIYKDPSLPGVEPETRRKIYTAMNRTISQIHSVDVVSAGLSDYGKVMVFAHTVL